MRMIIISLSNVCQELRQVIMTILRKQATNSILIEDRAAEGQIILPEEHDLQKVKCLIEKEFNADQNFNDYIAAENNEDEHEIAILKKGDIQQIGLFICAFCPMVFGSETEKNIHQRIHYFGFG